MDVLTNRSPTGYLPKLHATVVPAHISAPPGDLHHNAQSWKMAANACYGQHHHLRICNVYFVAQKARH